MIYLDNAATTYPKPESVMRAVNTALNRYGANPGRSGHRMSLKAAEEIYNCRKLAAEFFNVEDVENIVFTLNCTHAINIVLKGKLNPGDHVIVTNLEHNAVMRPLESLKKLGINYTTVKVHPCDNDKTINEFRKAINNNTKLIACTHASNVWGIKLPIERVCALAHQYDIEVLVDAAQTAGVLPIDYTDCNIDYLCLAGHKGLYGPMGTGMLITNKGENLRTLIDGGTGSVSVSLIQPETLPDRFESGTPNMPGISGLRAGMEFVKNRGIENIHRSEFKLITSLHKRLSELGRINLYMDKPDPKYFVPLLTFNVEGFQSEEVASMLNEYNIAVRAGIQCAPLAYEAFGTLEIGGVRVAPSAFNKISDIDYFISCIKKIIRR